MMHRRLDTIAAVATAPGPGGIGVVRISGPRAVEIGGRVFRRRGGKDLSAAPAATLVLGTVSDPETGELLDEALAVRMRPGRSYTGEETVELHCHGGALVLDAVLRAVLAAGARLADPGEFTRRAHERGRIDLSQAEAVAELIAARSATERRAALVRLGGATGGAVRSTRQRLLELTASVEGQLEFGEEEGLEEEVPAPAAFAELAAQVRLLVDAGDRLARTSRGARIVVAGRANCGKSSLFNRLASKERAVVTSIPGTTRDFIEERVTLAGADLLLVDTAGMREPGDEAEARGIALSLEVMGRADLVLQLIDGSRPSGPEDRELAQRLAGLPRLLVLSKCDLPRAIDPADIPALGGGAACFETSALTGAGCRKLAAALAERCRGGEVTDDSGPAPNPRQTEALARALSHLGEAATIAAAAGGLDRLAEELGQALHALEEVTGEGAAEELLDRVFSRFCVGK